MRARLAARSSVAALSFAEAPARTDDAGRLGGLIDPIVSWSGMTDSPTIEAVKASGRKK
jgi:hypothetical protein